MDLKITMTINEINNIKDFRNMSQSQLIDIIYFLKRENNYNLHNSTGANSHIVELVKQITVAQEERDKAILNYTSLSTGHDNIMKKITRKLTFFERLSGYIDLRN